MTFCEAVKMSRELQQLLDAIRSQYTLQPSNNLSILEIILLRCKTKHVERKTRRLPTYEPSTYILLPAAVAPPVTTRLNRHVLTRLSILIPRREWRGMR